MRLITAALVTRNDSLSWLVLHRIRTDNILQKSEKLSFYNSEFIFLSFLVFNNLIQLCIKSCFDVLQHHLSKEKKSKPGKR